MEKNWNDMKKKIDLKKKWKKKSEIFFKKIGKKSEKNWNVKEKKINFDQFKKKKNILKNQIKIINYLASILGYCKTKVDLIPLQSNVGTGCYPRGPTSSWSFCKKWFPLGIRHNIWNWAFLAMQRPKHVLWHRMK